ncbi:hypothetical protein MMB232_00185 [Brevundimonas subvibrioides]|uniref:Tat pathway signal protein n=1 Tax=Brevundimonas subvibrioides (strain ATCC 15264 / DSM 4735 / LMG 14903 / NBRC 16000 / CB 81) TaxID=633149 RepID=D9QJ27_BRESC|nr:hypothetical protein [Brevundimonas subvibrioides]ADK99551.1 conserved hypothetical protein [Brevundimonas subvibrioides ATCC 15264]
MNRRALLAAPLALAATPALASGGGGGSSTSTFFRYPTVTANTFTSDGRRGVMTVETGVDIADPALLLRAQQSAPRVRAVFNILVQREAATLLPGQPPNVDRLSRQFQSAMNIILRQRGARLLIGTVMVV